MTKRDTIIKFALFFFIAFVGVAADQWTKQIASDRLAISRPGSFEHPVILQVPASDAGKTVKDVLTREFTSNTPEQIDRIAQGYTRTPEGAYLNANSEVTAGQTIHVTRREIVVIEGYWDYQYARNPGAAFSFLADTDSALRTPFFIVVSIIALLVILYILKGVALSQQLMIWGLSFIAAGAVGNFIDRLRFGYVIDFIVWKYTDAHRWPTFNVADAFICVGVGLLVIETLREELRARKARKAPELVATRAEEDDAARA